MRCSCALFVSPLSLHHQGLLSSVVSLYSCNSSSLLRTPYNNKNTATNKQTNNMTYIPSAFRPPDQQQSTTSSSSSSQQPSQQYGQYNAQTSSGGGGAYVPSMFAPPPGGATSAAAAPSPYSSTQSSYTPSSTSYTPSSTTNSYNTGSYVPSSTAATTTSYTPSSTTNSYNTGSYVPSSTAATTTTSYSPSPAATQTLPSFSQALDLPPPTQQTATSKRDDYGSYTPTTTTTTNTSYGVEVTPSAPIANNNNGNNAYYNPSKPNMTTAATAMTSTAGMMTPTSGGGCSMTYQGGPTNGLVSEGNPVKCHKVDYEIKGHEMQLVEIELDPEETVIAEAGAMMFIENNIEFKAKFGDGSEPKQGFFKKLMSAGGRLLTGESLFITHFTNKGQNGMKSRVAFAAPYPGNIIPLNMMDLPHQTLICQKDAFLCAAKGTKISIHWNKKIGAGFFGGEGFILQKLEGDGMAFIHAGGTVIRRELRGERLRVDTGCVVAFDKGITFDVTLVPGLKSMFFGGEGLFLATLEGHGTVWLQSLPFSRMADRIIQHAPSAGGRRKGEGSALMGGFGGLIDGDGF